MFLHGLSFMHAYREEANSLVSLLKKALIPLWASQVAQWVKNLSAKQETREAGSIPGSGRSPGEGHGNPLQYSCLENPMDRGGLGYRP